jgi:CDP-diglyceride synthetase
MRASRAKSAYAARSRRPSVLFDIDEDNESNHFDSPSEVMSTLYCSPETRARRAHSAAAAPSSCSSSVLRRTFTGMEDGSMRDTAVDLQGTTGNPQQQNNHSAGAGGNLGTSLYSQALSNSKLEAPRPQAPAPPPPVIETPQNDVEAHDFQRQEDAFQDEPRRPGSEARGPRRQRKRSRARSRKQSIYSRWTYCGISFSNAVLRILTGLVVIPAVVCALLYAPPALTIAMLTVVILCLCMYEYAWMAHRIHYQLIVTYDWYENDKRPPSPSLSDYSFGASTNNGFGHPGNDGGVDCGANTNKSRRQHHGNMNNPIYQDTEAQHFQSFASGYTQSTSSSFSYGDTNEYANNWRGGDDDRESFADPLAAAEAAAIGAARPKAPSPLELLDLDPSQQVGVIGVITSRLSMLRGHEWIVRLVVAAVITTVWSLSSTMLISKMPFPVKSTPPVLDDFPYYFWISNFVASLCAVSTPTLPLAVALVVQKACFQVLLQNALNCPMTPTMTSSPLSCSETPITSMQTFTIGAMALMLMRTVSARNAADLVIGVMLDLLGYTYVTGTISLMASMIYPSSETLLSTTEVLFPRMWLVMLAVVWVSELVAYTCDAIMFHFRLRHMRLLPARLEFTFDIEAAIAAVVAGALVMVGGCILLEVPGGLLPKISFSAAGVFLGRFGRLLVSLIKKAAGVRWSGRLAPGFGGLMDATNSLLVTSVVFVKYYLYAMTLASSAASEGAASGSGSASGATSVDFSSAIAASLLGE